MRPRSFDRALRVALTLGAIVCVSSPMVAQRKPRLVAGCPSTPAAFHTCALEKAKTFTPPRTADGQPNLQGIYEAPMGGALGGNNSTVVDPPGGVIPYQPWAREQKTENVEKYIDPYTHCLPITAPRIMLSPRTRQIQQYPGYITIINESGGHPFRVVYMDGRPHLPPDIKLWRGDSRGRWDGNTLVIETANLSGMHWYGAGGDFFSDAMKLTERLTMIDANTIHYAATIDDPKVATRPWTMALALERNMDKGYEWMEEGCFESDRDTEDLLLTGFKMYPGPRFPK